MSTEHYTETIRRLEREQKHLRRDIVRYRRLMRQYEEWLKGHVLGGKRASSR